MKMIHIKRRNTLKQFILSCFVVLLFITISFNNTSFAQSADSLTESAVTDSAATESVASSEETAETGAGPSLDNLSKNSSAIRERLEEEARWNTIVSYIQMIVGFIITVTLAWFLASWARKQENRKAEEKRVRVEKALLRKGFTVVPDSEKKPGDSTVALKPPPGHRPPKRRR